DQLGLRTQPLERPGNEHVPGLTPRTLLRRFLPRTLAHAIPPYLTVPDIVTLANADSRRDSGGGVPALTVGLPCGGHCRVSSVSHVRYAGFPPVIGLVMISGTS